MVDAGPAVRGAPPLSYRPYRRPERFLGRRADDNLFVSLAMRQELASRWGLAGSVCGSRPTPRVCFSHCARQMRRPCVRNSWNRSEKGLRKRGAHRGKATSWTADEDFALLLDALVKYDHSQIVAGRSEVPRRRSFITGRGPLREAYERRFIDVPAHAHWRAYCVARTGGVYPGSWPQPTSVSVYTNRPQALTCR